MQLLDCVEVYDLGPSSTPHLQEPLDDEHLHGLAQGGATHAELSAELRLRAVGTTRVEQPPSSMRRRSNSTTRK